uniref:F-box domain-containing protein n=1 Tax=Ananas comosus var. bracteatus TaxID=296719 RepID=A0A6V7Q360_ANACO|nr:unnamed protein product [Ananas comosus var. bracteatus]
MGCCGEDNDDNLLEPLLPPNPNPFPQIPDSSLSSSSSTSPSPSSPSSSPSLSSSSEVISPMNSHFSALSSGDLLRSILASLPPADLARAACVCRLWRAVASDREMLERAFRAPWRVRRVLGTPSSAAFWRHPALSRFAISHRLLRGDTVAGLALKYSVKYGLRIPHFSVLHNTSVDCIDFDVA